MAVAVRRRLPAPLQIAAYRRFWASAQASNAGTWMQQVAAAWIVFDQTGSPAWTGAVTLAQRVPGLVLTPLGGALADRHDRRIVIAATVSIQLTAAVALMTASVLGIASPAMVLCLAVLSGIGQVLAWPALLTTATDLVPRESVQTAVSLNSAGFNLSRIAGPAAAGALLAATGPTACFAINAISFVPQILVARTLPRAETARRGGSASTRGALAHVRATPALRRLLAGTAVFCLLASPLTTLAPVYADALGAGPRGLGLLLAAFGVGAVIGAPIGVRAVARGARGTVVGVAMLVFAGLSCLLAVAPSLPVALALSPLAGAAWLTFFTTTNAGIQLLSPAQLKGRILGLYLWLFSGAMGVAALGLGAVAGAIGAREMLVAAAVPLALYAAAILARPVPGLGRAATRAAAEGAAA